MAQGSRGAGDLTGCFTGLFKALISIPRVYPCHNPTPVSTIILCSAQKIATQSSHLNLSHGYGNIWVVSFRVKGVFQPRLVELRITSTCVTLRQQPAISEFLRQLKAVSSGWVHDFFPEVTGFWWQTGYGAFTVSHSVIDSVKAYIENQEEHHKTRTFQEEYRMLLIKHRIKFDEEYIWD